MIERLSDKLEEMAKRYDALTAQMAEPDVANNYQRMQVLVKERLTIEQVVSLYRDYRKTSQELAEHRTMMSGNDPDLAALAREEVPTLEQRQAKLSKQLELALLPKDPNDDKSVIMEIRGGTGGDEAALFAADLYRMYSRHAEMKGWKTEVLDHSDTGIGGYKEIVFEVNGKGAYSRLKHESGVHRVQRVPSTETAGRIHTSTATVAVLPEVEEVDVNISPADIRIDIYHASGHGGQNVQKVSTAVRIVHIPTGIVATCQDERSQLKNRLKAMSVLRARIYDMESQKQANEQADKRRAQVGTAERSEKIRTYNFPQDRMTDHRLEQSWHNLPRLLEGRIDEVLDALAEHDQAERMQEAVA